VGGVFVEDIDESGRLVTRGCYIPSSFQHCTSRAQCDDFLPLENVIMHSRQRAPLGRTLIISSRLRNIAPKDYEK
jgi:hypothetical protein